MTPDRNPNKGSVEKSQRNKKIELVGLDFFTIKMKPIKRRKAKKILKENWE
jgi:hypothetical protein